MSASAEDGAALQQFCLLAKSAKGAACASLIGQALEHPGVFVFGELLDMPSVKEARPSSTTRRSAAPPYRHPTRPCTHGALLCRSSRARPRRRISSCSSSSLGERGRTTRVRARAPRCTVLTHHAPHVRACALRVHCVCTCCPSCCPRSLAARCTRLSHATLPRISLTRLSHAPLSRASLTRLSHAPLPRASPTQLSHAPLAPAAQARPRSYPRCRRRR